MKQTRKYILLILILALLWPTTVFAKGNFEDKVVFGGTFTLESGESLHGSLVIFGGAVTLEADSTVNGDVVLIGGTVEINGQVNGSLVGIGGAVRLNKDATVNGDLVTIGATLRREEGATVNGEIVNGLDAPFTFNIPSDFDIESNGVKPPTPPQISVNTNPFLEIVWFFFRTFMFAGLAILLVMFFSEQTERVSSAAFSQPIITAGAGLLTAVLAPLALVAITITIILIPVTFVAIILLVIAWLMGWVAIGLEVGRRVAKILNQEWAPAISAGIGTFILLFVLGGFGFIPCIGWLPKTLVGIWGLGAVLLTRFGTQDYTFESSSATKQPVLVEETIPEVIVEMDEADETPDLEIAADSLPADGLSPEVEPEE
jgi:hypothetical protein